MVFQTIISYFYVQQPQKKQAMSDNHHATTNFERPLSAFNKHPNVDHDSTTSDHNTSNDAYEYMDPIHNVIQALPKWADLLASDTTKQHLFLPEWDDPRSNYDSTAYRATNGWEGSDLIHSRYSAVRILHYYATLDDSTDVNVSNICLEGVTYFSPQAESHAGYCHGGSMCSVFDDAIGWCGFLATGKRRVLPWSGFTAQIDTALKKPVRVGSVLLIRARIVRKERRKVFVEAELVDPSCSTRTDDDTDGNDVVYATSKGLFLLKKGIDDDDDDDINM
mmetsp:Transcript_1576/g.2571  ORF Transcript_1576/g.2571 Transcript_1576/m.2571 type:complete len:278 (+) Transcript_1576:238-1071(+)|eukprot:CAMPEP_0196807426 /NCGR_PEP_ID=MMETSP1362-20130617/7405_1 /TAXON_ID=163516 /ORGANISM="Leptocylindrus danicus, Strain CCMP1856" /LENGTH=277 /DNA_ID=CAMNT_0042181347 /DNA_START=210 /DNA_END=1043 /DNA_ORIENTATION=+